MASATLDLNHRLNAKQDSPLPVWWRQRHTYVLAAVAAVQVIGCRWSMPLLDESRWAGEIVVGVLLGQSFLLGLWGALGGLGTLPRWGVVGLIYVVGVLAISLGLRDYGEPIWSQALQVGLMGALLVLGFAACLLPLRGLAGWRVDFDPVVYRDVRGRRGQVSFLDYAGYSVGIAAALAVARLAVQAELLDQEALLIFATAMIMVGLAAGPLTYAMVTWRSLGLALLSCALWPPAIAALHSLLANGVESLDIFGGSPTYAGMRPPLAGFYGGVALLTTVTLTTLRLCGLKLIVVPLPAVAAAAHAAESNVRATVM